MSDRERGRVMALDVGGRRTGVAISDELGILASPVGYVERNDRDRAAFLEIVRRWGITHLLVGLPTSMSGREGPQAAEVRAYADTLAADLDLPLDYWDERLTTAMAERALLNAGTRRNRRKEQIDAIAAAMILQSYLDAKRGMRSEKRGTRRGI